MVLENLLSDVRLGLSVAEISYVLIEKCDDSYIFISLLNATVEVPYIVMLVPMGTIQGSSLVRVILGDT
jgi:hypothetical protein